MRPSGGRLGPLPDPDGEPQDEQDGNLALSLSEPLQVLGRALRDSTRSARLTAAGTCLEPLVRDGDRLVVTAPRSPLRRGSLFLTQSSGGEVVCHRLVHVDRDGGCWLAGDRGTHLEMTRPSDLQAWAVEVERGSTTLRLHTPLGVVLDWCAATLHWRTSRLRSRHPLVRLLARSLQRLRRAVLRARASAWRRAG